MTDEKLCNSCKHRWEPEHQSSCWMCHDNSFYESDEIVKTTRRMTNFEKIKAMSVEDFIKMFDDSLCEYIQSHHVERCRNNSCYCCLANFLESEVDA